MRLLRSSKSSSSIHRQLNAAITVSWREREYNYVTVRHTLTTLRTLRYPYLCEPTLSAHQHTKQCGYQCKAVVSAVTTTLLVKSHTCTRAWFVTFKHPAYSTKETCTGLSPASTHTHVQKNRHIDWPSYLMLGSIVPKNHHSSVSECDISNAVDRLEDDLIWEEIPKTHRQTIMSVATMTYM